MAVRLDTVFVRIEQITSWKSSLKRFLRNCAYFSKIARSREFKLVTE